jgi:hypothetical protein
VTVHIKPKGASVGLFNTVWPHLCGFSRPGLATEAALAAAKAERAAPGSVADVRSAQACWSMLRNAAKVMLDYSNDAFQPRRVTPRKVVRKTAPKRRAKAA